MISDQERSNRKECSNPINIVNSLLYRITILVVDDDSTSLAIISAMLREFHYEVTSVISPIAALSILQKNGGKFDLVVTDLHMPEMNGIELQKRINRQHKLLPVVIMSSDNSESAMIESLASGAVFFIVKPVNGEGLKDVWQYAVSAKKGKAVVIEDLEGEGESSTPDGRLSLGNMRSQPSVNNDDKRGTKRKSSSKGKDDKDHEETNKKRPPKKKRKAKVVWTNELHTQFLEALRHIGFDKAVPKQILEHMNDPTLTRENVASHLQKYRMFLKRIAERGGFTSKALFDRFLKSTFAAGHPLLLKTAQEFARMEEMERMRTLTSYPGFGSTLSPHNNGAATRYGTFGFANNGASDSNSAPQPQPYGTYGGQSRLLSPQANNRPLLMNNQSYLGNNNRLGLSVNGGFSTGLTSGANSSYPHQIQPRPDLYNAGPSSSSQFRFGSPAGLLPSSSALGNGLFGSTGSSHLSLNAGYTGNNTNSYAEIRLSPDRQLLGMGQTTSLNGGGYGGSLNGTNFNENRNVAANMGNQTFPYMAQGGFSNPAFTASNQQANTSLLAGLGGNPVSNDYNSDHLVNNNVSNLDNLNNQQLGGGSGDGLLGDLILESSKFRSSNQQQQQQQQQQAGEVGVENPEFSFGSLFPEIYPTLDELLNGEFDESSDEDTGPFSEEDLGQVQSALEQLINPNNTTANNANASNESGPTELNQNTNQPQREGGAQLANSDPLSDVIQVNDAPAPAEDDSSDSQDSEDEDVFFESLLRFGNLFD